MNILKIYGILETVEEYLIKMNLIEKRESIKDGFLPILYIENEDIDHMTVNGLVPMRCVLINVSNNKFIYTDYEILPNEYKEYYKELED